MVGITTYKKWNLSLPIALGAGIFVTVTSVYLWSSEQAIFENHKKNTQTKVARKESEKIKNISPILQSKLIQATKILSKVDKKIIKFPAKKTSLKLNLLGTFININGINKALIAEKNKPAKFYQVKDKLPGGAYITGISKGSVELQRANKPELLAYNDFSFGKLVTHKNSAKKAPPSSTKFIASNNATHIDTTAERHAAMKSKLSENKRLLLAAFDAR